MANAAMVILWPNPDGIITISQRTAGGEIMPTVDNNPPRVATLSPLSTVSEACLMCSLFELTSHSF